MLCSLRSTNTHTHYTYSNILNLSVYNITLKSSYPKWFRFRFQGGRIYAKTLGIFIKEERGRGLVKDKMCWIEFANTLNSSIIWTFLWYLFSFIYTSKRWVGLGDLKEVCIPESFNTNISHQLFDYIITFVYQKALIRTFHISFLLHNNLFEFTALEHKFKRWFVLKKQF